MWARVVQDWPRWAQVAGVLLGSWQILAWQVSGHEPNLGVMTFAGALLMFQRAATAARQRKDES